MNGMGIRAARWLGFLAAWCWALAALAGDEMIRVDAGGQRLVQMPSTIVRVAVGDEKVAGIRVTGTREFILQGHTPGTTSLLIWLRGDQQARQQQVLVSRATLATGDALADGLKLRASGDLMVLSGTAPDLPTLAQARQQAMQAAGGDRGQVLDKSELPFGGEVQIDVRVVEFSRKVLNRAGLSFLSNKSGFTFGSYAPGALNQATLSNAGISADSSLPISQALNLLLGSSSRNLLGVISVLEGNGFARTLARPTLVAQSGRDAEFLAGGEFPVPVPQALGQTTIQYKPYGIRLQVSPTVLSENRIALTVSPEVSDLDFENSITINGVAVPSLATRRASTSVELGHGESFVIGGLVSQQVLRNVNKVPGLGDMPVLGAFFKSVSLSREDKELVFVVTPRLVRPLAAGTELGAMPGESFVKDVQPGWRTWFLSDDEFNGRYTGFSR